MRYSSPLYAANCKPCSVPLRATAIYLHISVSRVCFVFASAGSPTKFGFLACGVYPFHPACFHAGSSLWHFYSIFAIAFASGIDAAVR